LTLTERMLMTALESLTRDDESVLDTVTRSANHATLIGRFCDVGACP
jgi:hypothetical protein